MADTMSNSVSYTGRYLRFDLVARLGEATATEGAKQADKSDALSKVHTSVRALHPKPHFEKIKATNLDRKGHRGLTL